MSRCVRANIVPGGNLEDKMAAVKKKRKDKNKKKGRPDSGAIRKKYYAVKNPGPRRVFNSWRECQAYVKGKSRAVFKGFVSAEDAQAYLNSDLPASGIEKCDASRIYVDGSFMEDVSDRAGWAFVVVEGGKETARSSGVTSEPALSRNIDGEFEAVLRAAMWCEENGRVNPVIVHDYSGIAEFALGNWNASSDTAQRYVRYLTRARVSRLKMQFEAVNAHSGDKWNDVVDGLAKDAIRQWKE